MSEFIRIKTIAEVHRVFGMEKPKHPLVSVLPIDERMTNFDYGDSKYLFDFYQISFKSGFSGAFSYGRNSYDFEEGSLVFMKPNQVVKFDNQEVYSESSGWTLLFHPDLVRKSQLGKEIENYSFFGYGVNEALHLSEDEKNSLTELVQKIEKEYKQNIDKHSQELIIANIEMLLKYSKRFYDRQFYTRTNLNKDIISKFEMVMSDYYRSNQPNELGVLSVKFCAQQLNMSSNYFGDLIKNETGQSAKEHIQNFIIEKAKTRIISSAEPLSQIAYDLGFEYPQSFNKLFKAKTGISPGAYRRTLN